MQRHLIMMVMMMGLGVAGLSAQSRPPALETRGVRPVGDPSASAGVAAVPSLVRLDPATAWRMDVAVEPGETVVRWTPSDPESELQRVRQPRTATVEARVVFEANGDIDRLRVEDAQRVPVTVAAGATTTARQVALLPVRYTAAAKADLLQALAGRNWRALGEGATLGDATLTWRASARGGEEALWDVRLTTERAGVLKTYVARVDPTDGRLVELAREGVR
jgi:hypothetical protein